MTTDMSNLMHLAANWMPLQSEGRSSTRSVQTLQETSDQLTIWTSRIAELLRRSGTSLGLVQEAGTLFDEVAATSVPPDVLGEKFEIAAIAGFIAWRGAYLLNQEYEAQQWIRISDSLAVESTAERERLEAFIYRGDTSEQLCTTSEHP